MEIPRQRRCEDDRGVAVVEFALVLPVLMILLLGMVSSATAWNQSQALGQGSRVAARFASTMPLPPEWQLPVPTAWTTPSVNDDDMTAWLDNAAARAVAAAEGELAADIGGREVCVAYVDPGSEEAYDLTARRLSVGETVTYDEEPCFVDDQGTMPRVQVLLGRDGFIDTGFYRHDLHLERSAVYRFEADHGL